MNDLLISITDKRKRLQSFYPLPVELATNLHEWLKIELTYTSNAIEGNTLTRQETTLVVQKGLTVAGKSLVESLEAINHAQAFDQIKKLSAKKRQSLTEKDFLEIHRIILDKIDDHHAGRYRNVPVRIAGSRAIMPNPLKVPSLMAKFTKWLKGQRQDHPAKMAADAHFEFVSIHPFIDGNGRTARLIMNLLLMQEGYPPAIIKKEDRLKYIKAIEKAQLGGDKDDYYRIIYGSIEDSLDIYLETLEPKKSSKRKMPVYNNQDEKLLKIGELAKDTKESVATIRYWTNEGLLEVAEHTPKGYQLYHFSMLERIKRIRQLQTKRLTLMEIKDQIRKG